MMTTYELAAKHAQGRTSELDNALVAQKDLVLRKINAAEYADQLQEVLNLVNILAPVWDAVGYGYKTKEVRQRLRDTAIDLAFDNAGFIANERKATKARRFSQAQIEQLEAFIAAL